MKLRFGPTSFVFLSILTWLPGSGLVFASVGDYIWSPTLCCSSSNRRRAFSSRLGAFIISSSWGSGSRRGPSAPGWGPSSSAAAGWSSSSRGPSAPGASPLSSAVLHHQQKLGGLAVVGGHQLLVRGLHQQEQGHRGAGCCSTDLPG